MRLSQLKRESLREAVVAAIEEALLAGELRPGDRLVETTLAAQAGISRGPVREAVRQLAGEGVLVSYPSHGTFVARWTAQAVEEAYSLRAVLERLAVERVAARAADGDLDALQATVERMAESGAHGDARALVRLDVRFHEQLYVLSEHTLLQRTLSQLRRQMYALMGMDEGFAAHAGEIAGDHDEIVRLLRAGDGAAAAESTARHILAAGREVAEQVRGLGDG